MTYARKSNLSVDIYFSIPISVICVPKSDRPPASEPSRLMAAPDLLKIGEYETTWLSIRKVDKHGGKVLINSDDGSSEFKVMSPLTGIQDPTMARLVATAISALRLGKQEVNASIAANFRTISRVRALVFIAIVVMLVASGYVSFLLPDLLSVSIPSVVLLCLLLAFSPTLIVSRTNRELIRVLHSSESARHGT